jgi:acetate kinase
VSTRRLLALNIGSSTLKAAVFAFDEGTVSPHLLNELARAEMSAGEDPQDGLAALLQTFSDHAQAPDVVVHRIVHGGDRVHGLELDAALLAELDSLAPLAPLHQPAALAFARAARLRWPQARQGAAFDTSFHADLAPWSRRLPIPAEWDALGVRRYGFHGLAFASALRGVSAHAPEIHQERAVFAHLGGGCSVCAVERGVSRDTTMALTPLGGIPGPARSGDLDPGAVFFLLRRPDLDPAAIEKQLSHAGGMAGIAGHGDMRVLLADSGPAAKLAIDQFVIRIAQAIAAMATAAGGLDHLVFSGGIGHRSPAVRERIVARLAWLGLALDSVRNETGHLRIDAGGSAAVWNVAVDEERELAESALTWL